MNQDYKMLYHTFSQNWSLGELSYFTAMRGKYYIQSDVRLMLIGRAPNGWSSFDHIPDANAFAQQAEQEFFATDRVTYNSETGKGWIEDHNGILRSHHGSSYCLNQSPFWAYAKEIWKGLQLSAVAQSDNVWMENIAWSNLYKISPRYRGNPNGKMRDLQREECIQILKKEMDEWKPTHILLMTGFDWFVPFSVVFEDVKTVHGPYVKATAKYKEARVVVVCRPEYRNKGNYVKDVLRSFSHD